MDDAKSRQLVDFHCHLDLLPDMHAAYDSCERANCITLAVTTTPKAFGRNQEFADRTRNVHAALGLHPQLVAKRGHEISLFEELASSTRFIGEIGLDAGRQHYPSFEHQKNVFDRALNVCARQGEKIISIHSVRSARQVLDAIESSSVTSSCHVVLHWFSAGKAEIRRAVDLKCWFSVNQRMLASSAGVSLLDIVPQEQLLTETDAPFLEINGHQLQPGDVGGALTLIASHLGISNNDACELIASNAHRILAAHA